MGSDETMAEVMAAVAVAEATRTGLAQFVKHDGACWRVHGPDAGSVPDAGLLAVVLPAEDPMGVAKRIIGMRLSGLCVPQAVLSLVGAARKPEPKADRPTKAEIAASVSPPPPPEPPPAPAPLPPRVPYEVKPPATVQGSLF